MFVVENVVEKEIKPTSIVFFNDFFCSWGRWWCCLTSGNGSYKGTVGGGGFVDGSLCSTQHWERY